MGTNFDAALDAQDAPGKKRKAKSEALARPFDLAPVKASFADYEAAIQGMVAQAEAHQVVDDPTMKESVLQAGQAKSLGKKIDDQRKVIVDEPNRFVKAVNGIAKIFTEDLEKIERCHKKKIGDYQYRQELARREAEKRAQEEVAKLQAALDAEAKEKGVAPVQVVAPVLPEPDKVTRTDDGTSAFVKKVWTFEVTDEAQVPREYLMINEQKIRQAVRMGIREVPGVRIYEDNQINLRTA